MPDEAAYDRAVLLCARSRLSYPAVRRRPRHLLYLIFLIDVAELHALVRALCKSGCADNILDFFPLPWQTRTVAVQNSPKCSISGIITHLDEAKKRPLTGGSRRYDMPITQWLSLGKRSRRQAQLTRARSDRRVNCKVAYRRHTKSAAQYALRFRLGIIRNTTFASASSGQALTFPKGGRDKMNGNYAQLYPPVPSLTFDCINAIINTWTKPSPICAETLGTSGSMTSEESVTTTSGSRGREAATSFIGCPGRAGRW